MIYLARLLLRLVADLVQFTAPAFKPRQAIVAEKSGDSPGGATFAA
jgi:hypothetical protein